MFTNTLWLIRQMQNNSADALTSICANFSRAFEYIFKSLFFETLHKTFIIEGGEMNQSRRGLKLCDVDVLWHRTLLPSPVMSYTQCMEYSVCLNRNICLMVYLRCGVKITNWCYILKINILLRMLSSLSERHIKKNFRKTCLQLLSVIYWDT